ncbi:MAG: RidA family protein [Candidatus Peregrinibacteria bacterium]
MVDNNLLRQVVNTSLAPDPETATVQCVRSMGMFAFTSAITGENPETGILPADFATQVKNAMYNLRAVLEASRSDLLSTNLVFIDLADAHYLLPMNEIYKAFFPTKDPPARRVAIVSSLPGGALVQITVIASARESI